VTPGANSQQIRQLEDFLEIKIFKRMNRAIVLTDVRQLFLPIMVENEVIKIGRSRIEAACRADVLVCSCCCLLPFTAPWWPNFDTRIMCRQKVSKPPTLVLTLLPKGLLIFAKADAQFQLASGCLRPEGDAGDGT
jgi:hypothetical protein